MTRTMLFRVSKRLFSQYSGASHRLRAKQRLTPVTIQQMHVLQKSANEQTLVKTGDFLQKEIPIRLAKQIVALENLPYNLSSSPEVQLVNDLNKDAFNKISVLTDIKTKADAITLAKEFRNILNAHYLVVPLLNLAIHSSSYPRQLLIACPFLTSFLSSYFTRRIGIRIIMSQYSKILSDLDTGAKTGEIDENCNVGDIVQQAINEVVASCENVYGYSPPIHLVNKQHIKFKYVGRHIKLMTVELLRNALRATCELRPKENIHEYPVKIVICNGKSDVSIKVSDMGGGIGRDQLDTVWNYGSTSGPAQERLAEISPKLFQDSLEHVDSLAVVMHDSLVKLGYGLPVARLYARYFGGELELYSIEGHGLDAFVHLKLASHVIEPRDIFQNTT